MQLSVLALHQIGGVCGGTGGGGDGVGESGVGGGGVFGGDGESGGGCIGGDGGAGGIKVICTLKMSVYCCDKSSMIQGCSRSAGTHGVRELSVHSARGFVLPGISVVSNPPDARTREATPSTMLDAGGIGGGDGCGGRISRSENRLLSKLQVDAKNPAHEDVWPALASASPSARAHCTQVGKQRF